MLRFLYLAYSPADHLKRLAYIRDRLQEQGMQVDEAPDDDAVRETYNFAPGNFGAVYRADITDKGSYDAQQDVDSEHQKQDSEEAKDDVNPDTEPVDNAAIKYKLQSMKWGLIPFWTKRQPDYGSMMRTINCRDDSLAKESGMWTTMKRRKRCVVVCQGFYEWLKKGPGGKEKVPHFIRRKDGELMCFAGLWDCVSYEGMCRPF
jgi:putative SOS response-associated peptidase YedK